MSETGDRPDVPAGADSYLPEPDASPARSANRWRRWLPDGFLLLLVPIIGVLAAVRLDERLAFGPSWDTYAFLDNAADMAGRSVGYVEPHRPPFLSFLTSLLLRAGAWNVSTIQIVDVALSVIGVIAFYLLLRRRFERPLAVLASILLVLVGPVWVWLGSGYTDFPSVSLSICAILLFVKATEDDPRWYWAAFPVLLFAILTRFGAILMIFPVLLWLALRSKPFQQADQIATGVGWTILAYVPAGYYYYQYFGDPFFPFSFATRVADAGLGGPKASAVASAARPAITALIPGWFYMKNIPELLFSGPQGPLITWFLVLAAVGLAGAAVAGLRRQTTVRRALIPIGAAALVLLLEFQSGSVFRVIAITALGFAIAAFMRPRDAVPLEPGAYERPWRRFRRSDPGGALALDATMLVWGLLFLDAHGHMQPQIDRYFITMAPAALYLVTLGWRAFGVPFSAVTAFFKQRRAARPDALSSASAALGIVALGAVAGLGIYAGAQGYSPSAPKPRDPIVAGAEQTAEWLRANDPDIAHKTVFSDVWPLTSWYLGSEAHPMPTFESAKAFPFELEKSRVDYFVTIRSRRYAGYVPVYGAASTTVLKYQSTFPRTVPAVAYLGDGWDAYVEQLCNFDFSLYFSSRRQLGTGTYLLDSLTPEQLSQFDAVAVFGALWRNKAASEKTLRTYVENGGTVIIDASHNMDGFTYPIVDTVFMDVLVRRKAPSVSSVITVSPQLAAQCRLPASFAPAPLRDENGGPWYGASYTPAPWSLKSGQAPEGYEVLASIGGDPAVLLQHMGKGRVFWVSENLVWHAYLEGNDDEVRLVRGIFREAVGLPATPEAEVAPGVKPWFVSRKVRQAAAAAARAKAKAKAKRAAAPAAQDAAPATGTVVTARARVMRG